jgi:hypothetical protein
MSRLLREMEMEMEGLEPRARRMAAMREERVQESAGNSRRRVLALLLPPPSLADLTRSFIAPVLCSRALCSCLNEEEEDDDEEDDEEEEEEEEM